MPRKATGRKAPPKPRPAHTLVWVVLLLSACIAFSYSTPRFTGTWVTVENTNPLSSKSYPAGLPFSQKSGRNNTYFTVEMSLPYRALQSGILRLAPDDCLRGVWVNDSPIWLGRGKPICYGASLTLDIAPHLEPGQNTIRARIYDRGGKFGLDARMLPGFWHIVISAALALWGIWLLARNFTLPTRRDILARATHASDILRRFFYTYRRHALFALFVLPLAAMLKASFFDFTSGDYNNWLRGWIQHIQFRGPIEAFSIPFSNYNVPYLYLLAIGDFLFPALSGLYLVKLLSIAGEGIAAYFMYKIIALKYGNRSFAAWAAGCLVFLILPVIVNGAVIGQCDIFYTAFLLATFHALQTKRPNAAMVYYGLAFSFKLQAVFFAPFLLVLFLQKEIPLRSTLLAPATYLLLLVPAWLAGWPLVKLLTIYWGQYNTFDGFGNAGNLYFFLKGITYPYLAHLGVAAAAIICLAFVAISVRSQANATREGDLLLATFFLALVPFVLPKMLDRYFFPVDLFALALAFYQPRWLWIALLYHFSSTLACPDWNSPLWKNLGWPEQGHHRMHCSVLLHSVGITALGLLCWRYCWKGGKKRPRASTRK